MADCIQYIAFLSNKTLAEANYPIYDKKHRPGKQAVVLGHVEDADDDRIGERRQCLLAIGLWRTAGLARRCIINWSKLFSVAKSCVIEENLEVVMHIEGGFECLSGGNGGSVVSCCTEWQMLGLMPAAYFGAEPLG